MAQPIYLDPELQGIERQRQLAQALQQRGMQTPQGQMVGGHFVAPSWSQYLANAFDVYGGKKGIEEAEKNFAASQQKQQKLAQQNIADALRLSKGGEETVYGAGMEGPTKEVRQIAPDTDAAIAKLLRPNATAMETTLGSKLLEQQFKEAKWEKVEQYDPKTGNTITGMVNVNSPKPESTFRPIAISKPAMSAKDRAELADKGIFVGGGAPVSGGVSMGGGQGGAQVVGDAKYMPANMPTYQYDPTLSPAQNRELQGQFAKEMQKNVKNAKDAFGTIQTVADILSTGKPSSGRGENIITGTREFFGGGGEQSKADAQLRVLGQKLVQQVPRFEGPQSDKDVASYQAAAGDIGNPNMPIESRIAALQTLVDLNKKYYPQGDWDKIDLAGPVKTRQTFLSGSKTLSPTEFAKGLNPQDQEAFNWARRNPNDPRATEIKKRLGIQ